MVMDFVLACMDGLEVLSELAAPPAGPGCWCFQLCAGQYGGAGRGLWRGLLYDEAVNSPP